MSARGVEEGALHGVDETVALVSMGLYLPERVLSSADIATRAGMSLNYIEDFLGIRRVFVPGPDDQPCAMAVRAARVALERGAVDSGAIDLVIYVGSDYKEYVNWTAALKLQKDLNATRAFAFDVNQTCTGLLTGLRVARDMMRADTGIRTVLLAGGQRSDHVDFGNPLTHFMLNGSAAGGAMILRRGTEGIARLLETHIITDGSVCEEIVIHAGGSKYPITAELRGSGLGAVTLRDPVRVGSFATQKLIPNMARCVRIAIERSRRRLDDLHFLAVHHASIDQHLRLLEELGLSEEQTVYLEDFGHLGPFDAICALELGARRGMLRPGDLAVCTGAGIGFSWTATALEWSASSYP